MMTHGCMLWGAALYNNGAVPDKWSRYGESYSMHGVPQRLQTVPAPTAEETARKGVLPYLEPLPRFEITQPGNILHFSSVVVDLSRTSVFRNVWRNPVVRGRDSAIVGWAPGRVPIPCSLVCRRLACWIQH